MNNQRPFMWWWSVIMCTAGIVTGVALVGALILMRTQP